MKRILVPTDFSTCANNAVDFAIQTAKIIPLQVTLVHALELTGDLYTDYMAVNGEFSHSLFNEVTDKLAKLKSSIEEKEGLIFETHVFVGTVKESIVQVASEKNIDFIIMGTAGASGIKEKLWGSKTAGIIAKSNVPVLAIPLEYTWKKPQKILLATNNFEKEPVLLDFLFALTDLYKAEMHVAVFTNEKKDNLFTSMDHSRSVSALKEMLTEQYHFETIIVAHLFGKNFEESLQEYIRENEIEIVSMVTHKRSFTKRLFHPDIVKRLSYHTKIPLLAIPVIHD
jgi:nucleotide-binding universal stress UspA family protein